MSDCHDCQAGTTLVAARPLVAGPPLTKQRIVAIIGPPNSGKSTLFNRLTGLRQKVANFPGVTVEHRMGKVKLDPGREIFVVDLPGVYSLTPRTEDERVTHDVSARRDEGYPEAGSDPADSGFHQSGAPSGSGRAGPESGSADAWWS